MVEKKARVTLPKHHVIPYGKGRFLQKVTKVVISRDSDRKWKKYKKMEERARMHLNRLKTWPVLPGLFRLPVGIPGLAEVILVAKWDSIRLCMQGQRKVEK